MLKQAILSASIMVFTSMGLTYLSSNSDTPLKKTLSSFPIEIGNWQGKVERFDDQVYKVLGVDDSFLASYFNSSGIQIQLYIGYYKSQYEGEIIHSPKNCMPGSGWNIIDESHVKLSVKEKDGSPIRVSKLLLEKGLQRQVAFYWYHSRGRIFTSEYLQKIYLVWDSITQQRTDGAFIRLLSPTTEIGDIQTTKNLKWFADLVFPLINDHIPH